MDIYICFVLNYLSGMIENLNEGTNEFSNKNDLECYSVYIR